MAPPGEPGPVLAAASVAVRAPWPEITDPSGPNMPDPPLTSTTTAAAASMAPAAAIFPAVASRSRSNETCAGSTELS